MFVYVLAECVQTFLVTQGLVQPTTIAKAIVTVLGPLYYYGCMFWWVAVAPGARVADMPQSCRSLCEEDIGKRVGLGRRLLFTLHTTRERGWSPDPL